MRVEYNKLDLCYSCRKKFEYLKGKHVYIPKGKRFLTRRGVLVSLEKGKTIREIADKNGLSTLQVYNLFRKNKTREFGRV